jgi:hypothetical protein
VLSDSVLQPEHVQPALVAMGCPLPPDGLTEQMKRRLGTARWEDIEAWWQEQQWQLLRQPARDAGQPEL